MDRQQKLELIGRHPPPYAQAPYYEDDRSRSNIAWPVQPDRPSAPWPKGTATIRWILLVHIVRAKVVSAHAFMAMDNLYLHVSEVMHLSC